MPARATPDAFEAAAAQGLGAHSVRSGASDNYVVSNGIPPARRRENVPHAAQIAFAFFPDISDEHKRQRMRNSSAAEHTDHGEHRRNARTIVGDSRAIQAGAPPPASQPPPPPKERIN